MNPMVKLSALAVMALCAACGVAADPAPAKPAGVRVGYTLILFGCEDTVVKAAGIDMHKTLGGPYLGTWHDMKGRSRSSSSWSRDVRVSMVQFSGSTTISINRSW